MRRVRVGLVVAAVVVPLLLYLLFERQARRLDALAATGQIVRAQVTRAARGTTHYSYRVDGETHSWSVKRSEAPFARGESFSAVYLPSDPSLSRPFSDRRLAGAGARRSRRFGLNLMMALGAMLAIFGYSVHRDIRLLEVAGPEALRGKTAYRRRLIFSGLALLPWLVLISAHHIQDAAQKGEAIAVPIVGAALSLLLVVGMLVYYGRLGPEQVQSRIAKVMRLLVPVAVVLGLLRLLALAVGG